MANKMDKEAFELLDEMGRRGISPRADTFNSILTGMTKVSTSLFCDSTANRPSKLVKLLVDKDRVDCRQLDYPRRVGVSLLLLLLRGLAS